MGERTHKEGPGTGVRQTASPSPLRGNPSSPSPRPSPSASGDPEARLVRARRLGFNAARVLQRTIHLTKENVDFPNAQAAFTNLSQQGGLGDVDQAALRLAVNYLDANNERYHDYKNLKADARAKALRAALVAAWSAQALRALNQQAIGALGPFDFYVLSSQQLAAFTPQQHTWLSSAQIDWLNEQFRQKGQPEVADRMDVQSGVAAVGSNQEATAVYTGTPLYHEKQKQGWCGKHALNAFLGKGMFSEGDLYKFAVEMAGDEEKAKAHITLDSPDQGKIGDISIVLLKWILTEKLKLPIGHFKLSELTEEELAELTAGQDSMIVTGSQKAKFPGETVHKSGHYAAARKGPGGRWWMINSTAAEQVQVDPASYSKALEIILPVKPEFFLKRAQKAALQAKAIAKLSFEDWKDAAIRGKIVSAIEDLLGSCREYQKISGKTLPFEGALAIIHEKLGEATAMGLDFDESFNMVSVFTGTAESFEALSKLVIELP